MTSFEIPVALHVPVTSRVVPVTSCIAGKKRGIKYAGVDTITGIWSLKVKREIK